MEVMYRDQPADTADAGRPGSTCVPPGCWLSTVVLHLVAMFPRYFGGRSVRDRSGRSPIRRPLRGGGRRLGAGPGLVLSDRPGSGWGSHSGWAGDHRARLPGGRPGPGATLRCGQSSTGMWLMTASWVTGAAGAIVAMLAVSPGPPMPRPSRRQPPRRSGTAGSGSACCLRFVTTGEGTFDPSAAAAPVPRPDPGGRRRGPKPRSRPGWAARRRPATSRSAGPRRRRPRRRPIPMPHRYRPRRPTTGRSRPAGPGPPRSGPPEPVGVSAPGWKAPAGPPARSGQVTKRGSLPVPGTTAVPPVDPDAPVPVESTHRSVGGRPRHHTLRVDARRRCRRRIPGPAPPAPSGRTGPARPGWSPFWP